MPPILANPSGPVGALDEPPVPLSVAAKQTGFPVSKLRRAAKADAFPTYQLHDSRILVFVADIKAALLAGLKDGAQ